MWGARVAGVAAGAVVLAAAGLGVWLLGSAWHAVNEDYQNLALIGLFCFGVFASVGVGVAVAAKAEKVLSRRQARARVRNAGWTEESTQRLLRMIRDEPMEDEA